MGREVTGSSTTRFTTFKSSSDCHLFTMLVGFSDGEVGGKDEGD